MNDKQIKIPTWFRVVAWITFAWYLLGVFQYLMQVTVGPEYLSRMTAAERDMFEKIPAWATAAFATGVFSGLLGAILLLIKRHEAKYLFYISLLAILVQMFHYLFISHAIDMYGPAAAFTPLMVILYGIFTIWFSAHAYKKSWIH